MALRQFDVEVHLAVGGAREEVVAAGVAADLLNQLLQQTNRRSASRLSDLVAAPQVTNWQVRTERCSGSFPRVFTTASFSDVPLVVGAPDVDDAVEAPPNELVIMIGDIGGEVRWCAVRSNEHVVLVFTEQAGSNQTAPSRSAT
jgi:hypothetical protein